MSAPKMVGQKRVVCRYCKQEVNTNWIGQHIHTMHKSKLPRASPPTLKHCKVCPRNYKCVDLNRHMKFVHCPEVPPMPYYHCEKCSETFFTQHVLEGHTCYGLLSDKDPYKRFYCPYCGGNGFEKKNNLLRHTKEKHSSNPPSYKCENCGFSHYRKWNLKIHLCGQHLKKIY